MKNFGTPIAGMSCRFPGAANVHAFWDLLSKGEEGVTDLPIETLKKAGVPSATIESPSYIRRAAILEDVDNFDHKLFGISVGEAKLMDPQQKQLLEVCYQALEDAAMLEIAKSHSTAVFASAGGITSSSFAANINTLKNNYSFSTGSTAHIAHDKDFLATRLAHRLNLKGPAITVQTACSSSLVALHLARQALYCGDCDIAIVAASCVRVPHLAGYLSDDPILSKDGHCRTFSQNATGTFFSSGVAAIVLRREEDIGSDHAYATVRGSAINNDGGNKVSYTASSVPGQVAAMTKAITNAGVDAKQISYVECHGTATKIGDPLEIKSLKETFSNCSKGYSLTEKHCGLGSVKSNIGHTEQAAGIAGLIKVALMLHHKHKVPTLHAEPLNAKLNIDESPFYVEQTTCSWKNEFEEHEKDSDKKRYAAVNSLGMGGTNAFAIVEEFQPNSLSEVFQPKPLSKESQPKLQGKEPPSTGICLYPLCLSAKNEAALIRYLEHWQEKQPQWKHYPLINATYSATISRSHYKYRAAALVSDMSELSDIFSIFNQHDANQTPLTPAPLTPLPLTPIATRACDIAIQLPSLLESSAIEDIIRCSRAINLEERYKATLNDLKKKGITGDDGSESLLAIKNIALTISMVNAIESVGVYFSKTLAPDFFPNFYYCDANTNNDESWQINYTSIQKTLSQKAGIQKNKAEATGATQSLRCESSSSKPLAWLSIRSPSTDDDNTNAANTNERSINIEDLVIAHGENWIPYAVLSLYRSGAQIDWPRYYAQLHPEASKVPLPTYVFDKTTFPLFLTPEENR